MNPYILWQNFVSYSGITLIFDFLKIRLFLLNFLGQKKHMNTMHYKKWLEVERGVMQTKTIMIT